MIIIGMIIALELIVNYAVLQNIFHTTGLQMQQYNVANSVFLNTVAASALREVCVGVAAVASAIIVIVMSQKVLSETKPLIKIIGLITAILILNVASGAGIMYIQHGNQIFDVWATRLAGDYLWYLSKCLLSALWIWIGLRVTSKWNKMASAILIVPGIGILGALIDAVLVAVIG